MKNNASMKTPTSTLSDAEFDDWFETTDVGPLLSDVEPQVVSPAPKRMGRPRIGKKITLTLPEETIEDLRARGAKLGLGYQTYARMVLMGLKDEKAG
jgi:predicted DNA binding CopG/RHH family protein